MSKQCAMCKQWKGSDYHYPAHIKGVRHDLCKACNNAVGLGKEKDPALVPANLVTNAMTTGPYKPEHMFAVRHGALDHVAVRSLRSQGRVDQYDTSTGSPILRSITAGDAK